MGRDAVQASWIAVDNVQNICAENRVYEVFIVIHTPEPHLLLQFDANEDDVGTLPYGVATDGESLYDAVYRLLKIDSSEPLKALRLVSVQSYTSLHIETTCLTVSIPDLESNDLALLLDQSNIDNGIRFELHSLKYDDDHPFKFETSGNNVSIPLPFHVDVAIHNDLERLIDVMSNHYSNSLSLHRDTIRLEDIQMNNHLMTHYTNDDDDGNDENENEHRLGSIIQLLIVDEHNRIFTIRDSEDGNVMLPMTCARIDRGETPLFAAERFVIEHYKIRPAIIGIFLIEECRQIFDSKLKSIPLTRRWTIKLGIPNDSPSLDMGQWMDANIIIITNDSLNCTAPLTCL